MPEIKWNRNCVEVVSDFHIRNQDLGISPFVVWAASTAEGLMYLADMDSLVTQLLNDNLLNHSSIVVDESHARWAAGSAVTAVDLCAAALGKQYCGNTGNHELDMRKFDQSIAKNTSRRNQLPTQFLHWVDKYTADQRYQEIQPARNHFTHKWLSRHIQPGRTAFRISTNHNFKSADDIVRDSANFAADGVQEFLDILETV